MYEPDEEDEVARFWREQSELPLLKRDFIWWNEVVLASIVGGAILVVLTLSLLAAIVLGIEKLIGIA